MLAFNFFILTLLTLLLFYLAVGRNLMVLIISGLWLTLTGLLGREGFFENNIAVPPTIFLVIVGGIALSFFFYKLALKQELNMRLLLLIHVLRIPVELSLYQLFLMEELPLIMTFKGWNYDIVMGVSALLMFLYLLLSPAGIKRKWLRLWNRLGLMFLTFIVLIALLSAPLPFQQLAFDQPNIAVQKFPYLFLPAFIVPIVYASHFLALQKLRAEET